MKDFDLKNNVLDEILSLMEGNMDEKLKNHPRLKKAKVTIEKGPIEEIAVDEEPKDKAMELMMGDKKEMMPGHEETESPDFEAKEEEISPEDIAMILKKLKGS